jgi:hypothetical protein
MYNVDKAAACSGVHPPLTTFTKLADGQITTAALWYSYLQAGSAAVPGQEHAEEAVLHAMMPGPE